MSQAYRTPHTPPQRNGVLLMTLVGLPLAAVVVWALARRPPATPTEEMIALLHARVTHAWVKAEDE
jgi:hypothetical protein